MAKGARVKQIDRYLLETLLWSIAGVLGILVILDGLSDLIDGLGDLSDTYGFSDLLIYIALTLPRRVEEFVPYATLIGALFGLGRLASSSELTIIRSAGVSMPRLAWMAVKPALIVALAGLGVGEYLAPVSEQIAVSQRALAQRDDPNLAGRYGAWNRDGGTFVHVDAVQRGGLIFGVTLIEFDESGALARSVAADRGTFQGDRWLLEGVATTEMTASGTQVSRQTTREWVSGITPNLLTLDTVKPESLPASQLWDYADYLRSQGLLANDIELAFWNKVLQPLSCAGLVVLAMSFIFGPLRETNMSSRIFVGVLAGVVFRISQDFFGPVTLLMGMSGGVAALLTVILCWSVGLVLLLRKQ